jgi:hypothetical protein
MFKVVERWCGRGDRALQECNLSTRLVRRLQVTQAPILRLWDRDFVLVLQTRPKAKNSWFISTKSLIYGLAGTACG